MKNILFIINPIAGGGKSKSIISTIESTMKKRKINYKIQFTTKPYDGTIIAEENVDKYDRIVAVGGDGTINEVYQGLINKQKGILGIIPCGTGNDLSKTLNIPKNIIEALDIICGDEMYDIDFCRVNDFSFLNISSIGFDADVTYNNNTYINKIIKNKISYLISIFYTLISFKERKITIEIDGYVFQENIMLLAVGNGRFYGGGLQIIPTAKIDDGFLDVCIISGLTKLKFIRLFPSIFKAEHIKHTDYVKIIKGKTVKIYSEEELVLNIDGEVEKKAKEIKFSIEESTKLKILYKKPISFN